MRVFLECVCVCVVQQMYTCNKYIHLNCSCVMEISRSSQPCWVHVVLAFLLSTDIMVSTVVRYGPAAWFFSSIWSRALGLLLSCMLQSIDATNHLSYTMKISRFYNQFFRWSSREQSSGLQSSVVFQQSVYSRALENRTFDAISIGNHMSCSCN